jgi:hypothetical protein
VEEVQQVVEVRQVVEVHQEKESHDKFIFLNKIKTDKNKNK